VAGLLDVPMVFLLGSGFILEVFLKRQDGPVLLSGNINLGAVRTSQESVMFNIMRAQGAGTWGMSNSETGGDSMPDSETGITSQQ